MGHADHDFLQADRAAGLNQFIHGGNEALATFQREALLAHVLGVQEALQAFGCGQTVQNVQLLLFGEVGLAADGLQLFLPPALLALVAQVHVFGADAAAIGLTQRVHQLAQAHALFAEEGVADVENGFLVAIGETVEGGIQLGNMFAFGALERVQIGPALAHVAVGGNQLLHGGALAAHLHIGAGLDHLGAALFGALGEGIDHRQMRHVLAIATVAGRHVLQRVEIVAPRIGHAARIGQVVFVHLFDVWRIATEKVRIVGISGINRCRARLL